MLEHVLLPHAKTKREVLRVTQFLFSYLFCEINKAQLKKELNSPDLYSVLNTYFLKNGYILKNCKLYVYAKHEAKLQNRRVHYKEYEIEKEDVPYLNHILLTFNRECSEGINLKEMDWLTSHLYSPEFTQYIGKYITKKMFFLVKSYGVSFSELLSEMQLSAVYAVYKQYPYFKNKLHALNTAKRAIHNKGINLILFYTRQKRQRLQKESNGEYSQTNIEVEKIQIACCTDYLEKKEIVLCFTQLQNKCNKRGRLLLKLLLGEYNKEFSQFLNTRNDTYFDTCSYSVYTQKVRKFLNVTPKQVQTFFNKLRPYL